MSNLSSLSVLAFLPLDQKQQYLRNVMLQQEAFHVPNQPNNKWQLVRAALVVIATVDEHALTSVEAQAVGQDGARL